MMNDIDTKTNTAEKYYTCFYSHVLSDLMSKSIVSKPENKCVSEPTKEVVLEPTKEVALEPAKKIVWESARKPEKRFSCVLKNPKNTRNFDKLKGITERRMCWNVENCGKHNTNPIPGEDWCYECAFLAKRSAMFFPPGTCDYCRVKLTQTKVQFPPYCTSVKPTCFFRQKFLLDHVDSRFQTNITCSYQSTLPYPCPHQ